MCRGRRTRILLHLHIQREKIGDSPAREPSWSAFWLQKPSIRCACVRQEDAGGREAGAPLDLKMPLENGRADERVSRGQASERAVCVCEAVSVEKGARRPLLPAAVVCPPGGPHRRRLAITAEVLSCWPSR